MRTRGLIFLILAILLQIQVYTMYTNASEEQLIPVEITPEPITVTQPQETPTVEPIEEPQQEPPSPPPLQKTPQTEPPNLDIPLNDDLKSYIYELCGMDDDLYYLTMAVIEKESQFDPYAVSSDGHDYGLMQLRDTYHDEWAAEYGVSDPKEAYDNVTIGIKLLEKYLDKWKHKNLALMCYNNGPSKARNLWNDGIYSTKYTVKVLNSYENYKQEEAEKTEKSN